MPYRAPELFDVKTGKTLDEKVDIWVSRLLMTRSKSEYADDTSLSAVPYSLVHMGTLHSRQMDNPSPWRSVVVDIGILVAIRKSS